MTIEEIRAYWDRRPCNVHHSPISVDELPYLFHRQVTTRKYSVEPHIPSFANFPHWDKCSVLELGCGIGTAALSFAEYGAGVVAIDISEKSLEIARKRAGTVGLRREIVFAQGDIEELDTTLESLAGRGAFVGKEHKYKDSPRGRSPSLQPFDLVYSFGVLHHTPHPERVLQQVKHYMRPGSILKVMLYHRYTPKVLSALVRHWRPGMTVDDAVAQMSEAQAGSPLTRTYTKASARKLLKGFEILDMHVDHIFPWRIEDYIHHQYVVNWWWRWVPGRLFCWLERHFGWHLLITARLEEK